MHCDGKNVLIFLFIHDYDEPDYSFFLIFSCKLKCFMYVCELQSVRSLEIYMRIFYFSYL